MNQPSERMWFCRVPALLGIVLWAYIFVTARRFMVWAVLLLAGGLLAFLLQAFSQRAWPFSARPAGGPSSA